VLGRTIDQDPCSILGLFPKDKAAGNFTLEKFDPMIRATACLGDLIDLTSRSSGNRLDFKSFPGGFLKLVGSNSPMNVKSTPAKMVFVEEPDECNTNLKGQGDSIALARERTKTFSEKKLLGGGTPTIDEVSAITAQLKKTDQRRYFVPCHDCGHAAPLAWEQVKWNRDPSRNDPLYGDHLPETARYCCAQCGSLWTDAQKNANVSRADEMHLESRARGEMPTTGWIATAPFRGSAGFYGNEIMCAFAESRLEKLARKFLEAHRLMKMGDAGDMTTFFNASLGLAWKVKSPAPEIAVLEERALPYQPWTVPAGGLILTASVDVQHDRLHVHVWAHGRDEEAWLVARKIIPGQVSCPVTMGVWPDLDQVIAKPAIHACGAQLRIRALSIDSSDGQTNDAVYAWVRDASRRHPGLVAMAVRGAKERTAKREIYSPPKDLVDATPSGKAAKWGVRVYIVGTHKAKDLIYARLKLAGEGPGRIHWYEDVEDDFLPQLTSEVKVPLRNGEHEWQVKSGERNEDLDCAVYGLLHAARRLSLHRLTHLQWDQIEEGMRQADLLAKTAAKTPARVEQPSVPRSSSAVRRGSDEVFKT
jgi:phage terminase large subunit GpA-like protein